MWNNCHDLHTNPMRREKKNNKHTHNSPVQFVIVFIHARIQSQRNRCFTMTCTSWLWFGWMSRARFCISNNYTQCERESEMRFRKHVDEDKWTRLEWNEWNERWENILFFAKCSTTTTTLIIYAESHHTCNVRIHSNNVVGMNGFESCLITGNVQWKETFSLFFLHLNKHFAWLSVQKHLLSLAHFDLAMNGLSENNAFIRFVFQWYS